MKEMEKIALVFVGDPEPPSKSWEEHEYDKANTFMEGLICWQYQDDSIWTVGDSTKFFHGKDSYPCKTTTAGEGLLKAFGEIETALQVAGGSTQHRPPPAAGRKAL